MSSEVKFAWDVNKHDEENKKEEAAVYDVKCGKCGASNFLPVHNVQVIKQGSSVQIAFSNPPAITCIQCGKVTPPGDIINRALRPARPVKPPLVPGAKGEQ